MNRRQLLQSAVALSASAALPRITSAQTKPVATRFAIPDNLVWHDVREWGLEGRGFDDTENYFDRLPARAKSVVREKVWNLSHDTAGMAVRFDATTPAIYVRYETTRPELASPEMPATGVSGLDLYATRENSWHWLATHQPVEPVSVAPLQQQMPLAPRSYHLNLPLYNGVKSLAIGIPKDASFTPTPPRKDKAILFYGTSITQGGSASRPGMSFLAILGRRLNRPIYNFGFSGNGVMEVAVARFLAELDPAVFVLDCMANMHADYTTARTEAVVKLLREHHRDTPILLLGERITPASIFYPATQHGYAQKAAAQRAAYDHLIESGVTNLHYQKGDDLIGTDGDATVDGSHPTDLGMFRYAGVLEPLLKPLI